MSAERAGAAALLGGLVAANEPQHAISTFEPAWLSINGIAARWSCSKTFVYGAISEMQRGGYLRRLRLGRVARIALDSVERYESDHMEVAAPRREIRCTPQRPKTPSRPGDAIRALHVA